MLVLPLSLHDEMVAHAKRGLPEEACGLFATFVDGMDPTGARVEVTAFYPMRNAAASQKIYQLDGAEMLAVERAADASGQLVVGVMHSHTHTTAYPSPTDVADANAFDPFGAWHFVIVSLRDPDPALRSYRIRDGNIVEEDVVLLD